MQMRRRSSLGFLLIPFVIATQGGFIATAGHAETMEIRLKYSTEDLAAVERNGFIDLQLPGCRFLQRVGAPALPCVGKQVVLPAGTVAEMIDAVSLSSIRIPCGIIRPAERPAVLGPIGVEVPPPDPVRADLSVYEGTELYPRDLVVFRGTGHFADLPVASCEVHPVQYDPVAREIILHTEIALRVDLREDLDHSPAKGPRREMTRIAHEIMRGQGAMQLAERLDPGLGERLDPGAYQYIIVTDEAQESAYQIFADWKTAKGVPADVVTVEWISATYTGRDLAEQIRNFVIDAVGTWGVSYLLIGGDHDVVPSRVSWAFDCEAGFYPDENDIYADLYYSDLDGTWDGNGNGVFGEVGDNIDLYPDILVGRAPSGDLAEAQAIVNKFLSYEQNPPVGHAMEAFFFAEVLWSNPYTDSGIGKDRVADLHFGSAYEPIERHYESDGNESPISVLTYMNWGPHLANHGGHANYELMGCGTGYIYRWNVDALTNGPRYFVLYSMGCWSAAFDHDCIGEHFLTNGNGGAVAFIGNSRYGWGSPGNPGWGYSETFDRDFYGAILTEELTQFGAAVARAKILRIPFAQDENVYRVHEYQVNLLGDPEMACNTAEIGPLMVEAPATIPTGQAQFTATVSDMNGPVSGARVCLSGPDAYQVGITDGGGQVLFSTDLLGAQTLTVTATAANHAYTQTTIAASGNDPFLTICGRVFDEDGVPPSAGNGDGEIGAGETVELFVTVHNYGGSQATSVTGTLSESSAWVTLIADQATYGTVLPGGEATNVTAFVFEVLPGCPEGEVIELDLVLQYGGRLIGMETVPVIVVAPGPRFHYYSASEVVGDGDGVAESGETVALTVYVKNEGSGNMGPLAGTMTTTDPNLIVIQGSAASAGGAGSGDLVRLTPDFQVEIRSECPETTYCSLDINLVHDEGTDDDSFLLAVGEAGFMDDTEGGEGGWTHFGSSDLWHLDEFRKHSGTCSWYCGTATHYYYNNTSATLLSPEFVVPEEARLSFWCYFGVTIYGVDGLFVEAWDGAEWETLDYLGSGGALDSTLFVCGWAEHVYDVSHLTPGSTTQIRYRLVTDNTDTEEGFYIDDVAVQCMRSVAVEDRPGIRLSNGRVDLRAVSANPVSGPARWMLSLPVATHVTGDVYDTRGRLVRKLLSEFLDDGGHEILWDGRTDRGTRTSAGLYFLRVRAGGEEVVRKIVRLQE